MDTGYMHTYYLPQVHKANKIEVLCIVKNIYAMWNKFKNSLKIKRKMKFAGREDSLRMRRWI